MNARCCGKVHDPSKTAILQKGTRKGLVGRYVLSSIPARLCRAAPFQFEDESLAVGSTTQSQESHCGSKSTSANCPIASLIPRFLICKIKSEDVDFSLLYVRGFFISKETTDLAAP